MQVDLSAGTVFKLGHKCVHLFNAHKVGHLVKVGVAGLFDGNAHIHDAVSTALPVAVKVAVIFQLKETWVATVRREFTGGTDAMIDTVGVFGERSDRPGRE